MSDKKARGKKGEKTLTPPIAEEQAEVCVPKYYLPLKFETTVLYATKGLRHQADVFDCMHKAMDSTGDVERLAFIIDENSPEFEEVARDIQEDLQKLLDRFPEYR